MQMVVNAVCGSILFIEQFVLHCCTVDGLAAVVRAALEAMRQPQSG